MIHEYRTSWYLIMSEVLNVIVPTRLSRTADVRLAWYSAFCTNELTYHAMSISAGICRGVLNGEVEWTNSPEMLIHKTRAISLVRQQLATHNQWNNEWLIYAILCIGRASPERLDFDSEVVLPFVPHIPQANWNNVYERVELTEPHREAIYELLRRHGSVKKLKTPGLALLLTLYASRLYRTFRAKSMLMNSSVDLMLASKTLQQPRIPRSWEADLTLLRFSQTLQMPLSSPSGLGFVFFAPRGLPAHATKIFVNLSRLDVAMNHFRDQDTEDTDDRYSASLLGTRNAIHHDLLSLPHWEDLDDETKSKSYTATYEICRITCILYSNTVLMGLPPHSGWHINIVTRLRMLLELSSSGQWSKETMPLLTWALFVAGIASYRTPHRGFFERHLRDTLLKRGISSWKTVRQGLLEFIWSDSACGVGAAVLWDALDLPGT